MRTVEWWHLQWPWRTYNSFSRSWRFVYLKNWQSFYRTVIGIPIYRRVRLIPFHDLAIYLIQISMSLHFLKLNIWKRRILKTKLLLHTNRKLYLTYGMVLCLVHLTDMWTRRTGLSASAELPVFREVMSSPVSVCLSVCLLTRLLNTIDQILIKFYGMVRHNQGQIG